MMDTSPAPTSVAVSRVEAEIREALLAPDFDATLSSLLTATLAEEQAPSPVVHRFAPGVYVRELTLPGDTFNIGAYQKHPHLVCILKGSGVMLGDRGLVEVKAPMTFLGAPGRRVGYAREEVVWQNIYASDLRDVEALEDHFFDRGDEFRAANAARLAAPNVAADLAKRDFIRVLAEFGQSLQDLCAAMRTARPLVEFPYGGYKVIVSHSQIHGRGLFATAGVAEGERIAPYLLCEGATPAAQFANHSPCPNATLVASATGIDVVALRSIAGSRGGFVGEEVTIDYRSALPLFFEGTPPCLVWRQQS